MEQCLLDMTALLHSGIQSIRGCLHKTVQDLQKSKPDCVGEAHKPPPLTEGLVVVDSRQLPQMGESQFSGSVASDRLIRPCVHGQRYWDLVNYERDREKKREGRDVKLGEPGKN